VLFETSARTGEGIDRWIEFLVARRWEAVTAASAALAR
jgi:hydrogenase nickel incorporation protein HypB